MLYNEDAKGYEHSSTHTCTSLKSLQMHSSRFGYCPNYSNQRHPVANSWPIAFIRWSFRLLQQASPSTEQLHICGCFCIYASSDTLYDEIAGLCFNVHFPSLRKSECTLEGTGGVTESLTLQELDLQIHKPGHPAYCRIKEGVIITFGDLPKLEILRLRLRLLNAQVDSPTPLHQVHEVLATF